MKTWLGQYCINVSDIERSEAFYTDVMGLKVGHRIEIPGVKEVVLSGVDDGMQIQLAQQLEKPGPIEHGNAFWKLYINTDDCQGLYDRAVAAGAGSISGPEFLEQWSVTIAMIKDPDGYEIELVQSQ